MESVYASVELLSMYDNVKQRRTEQGLGGFGDRLPPVRCAPTKKNYFWYVEKLDSP